eukprot:m.63856 g.63856  ORF g.63856 m.63856 type:complete len:383 (+) comp11974_c0_seq1:245-1393(+)
MAVAIRGQFANKTLVVLGAFMLLGVIGLLVKQQMDVDNEIRAISHQLEEQDGLPDDLEFVNDKALSAKEEETSSKDEPKPAGPIVLVPRSPEKIDTSDTATNDNTKGSDASPATLPKATKPSGSSSDPLDRYNIVHLKTYPIEEINGAQDLIDMGLEVPALKFDYDDSAEAKAQRYKEQVEEMVAQGMPEMAAQLRAQLLERELEDKRARAIHSRQRAIVRLKQEEKMKADAAQREARLQMMAEKQRMVEEMLERNKLDREESERQKEEKRKQMEEEEAKRREEAEKVRLMKEQIRLEHLERQNAENERRRQEEKEEKERERLERERQQDEERESKRRMLEEFQALQQQRMEENKRIAREERMREMQEAEELRAKQQALLQQ